MPTISIWPYYKGVLETWNIEAILYIDPTVQYGRYIVFQFFLTIPISKKNHSLLGWPLNFSVSIYDHLLQVQKVFL